MNTKHIEQLLELLDNKVFFVGQANKGRVEQIETQLSLTLPDSYKWFLQYFGHGGGYGVEILGNGLAETASCVETTLDWRNYGLPASMVVVEDEGIEWIYCLDISRMKNGECPVVDWEQRDGIGKEYFETFLEFFASRLKDSLDMLGKHL